MASPYSTPPQTPPSPEIQYVPATSGRPTGVTVFAILSILFGFMGVLGTIGSAAMLFIGDKFGANPVTEKLMTSSGYFAFTIAGAVLGFIFSIVLLASGIGLLKMSKTARKMAIAYGFYAIVATILVNVVNVVVIFLPLLQQAGDKSGPEQTVAIATLIGAVIGAFVGLIFPVALLIYFLMPSVREKFDSWERPAIGAAR